MECQLWNIYWIGTTNDHDLLLPPERPFIALCSGLKGEIGLEIGVEFCQALNWTEHHESTKKYRSLTPEICRPDSQSVTKKSYDSTFEAMGFTLHRGRSLDTRRSHIVPHREKGYRVR